MWQFYCFAISISLYLYSALIFTSHNVGLYFFKYLPFMFKVRFSEVNSSISYAPLENICELLKGPSQLGDHFPKSLSFRSIGRMVFHTKSPILKVFDLTFL